MNNEYMVLFKVVVFNCEKGYFNQKDYPHKKNHQVEECHIRRKVLLKFRFQTIFLKTTATLHFISFAFTYNTIL